MRSRPRNIVRRRASRMPSHEATPADFRRIADQCSDSAKEMAVYDRLPPDARTALQMAPRGVDRSVCFRLLQTRSKAELAVTLLRMYDQRFPGYTPPRTDMARWRDLIAGAGFEPATSEV